MSSLGFQTIYKELNKREDTHCERAFLSDGFSSSLETNRPLDEFDVVAFSVSFELDYINLVKILKDAGMPLNRKDRQSAYPLIMTGGMITSFNFRPLLDFVDVFVLGEADCAIHEAFDIISENIKKDKIGVLEKLSGHNLLYVPEFPNDMAQPARIENLDKFDTSTAVFTPKAEFADTCLVELTRGCARRCSFCVTAYACGNFRIRSPDAVMRMARRGFQFTHKIGLVGAAVSDYPHIEELCRLLLNEKAKVSFSSLRADKITPALIEPLVKSGQRSLTIAPEAGSERLRDFIKKGVSDKDIFKALSFAREGGIQEARLYFMVGLPTEGEKDVAAIINLARELSYILPVKVKLAPFVPKPKTPFENYQIEPQAILKDKIKYITSRLRPLKRVKVAHESVRLAHIEARLAKGGADALYPFI